MITRYNHLPLFVRTIFVGVPVVWKGRHFLLFQWLIYMQATSPCRKNLKEMSRWTPSYITDWRFRRLLKASYISMRMIVIWLSNEIINDLTPSEDSVIYVIGDGSKKEKRGKKNPAVQKGRSGKNKPFFFGLRFSILLISWNNYRIPYDFRIILPKKHAEYKNENQLFREMLDEFKPPEWSKKVIVLGDAGYCSKENLQKVLCLNAKDSCRNWFFVFSIARTWKTTDNKSIKNLATYLPKNKYKKTWLLSSYSKKRKIFWLYSKKICLRHVGDVTIVLSKKRRNSGPKKIKLIVTNLPSVTPRQVIYIYQRRWDIEIIFKDLKSGLGLGQHQVTKEIKRVENSIGVAVVAYLFLLKIRKKDIVPKKSWSIFQLQNNFRIQIIENHVEHKFNLKVKSILKYNKISA